VAARAKITVMPRLAVNGENREVRAGATVRDLVLDLGLTGKAVAVELNKQVVPRREHEKTVLHDGDVVEVVALVGGG
jgi:thiamine biosynthesis protein ThiS